MSQPLLRLKCGDQYGKLIVVLDILRSTGSSDCCGSAEHRRHHWSVQKQLRLHHALHHVSDGKPLQTCRYSQFQQLTDCSRQHISPTTSKTTRLQDYTTKGWRFALMPPWASRHIGGSRSMPTVHRCRKDGRPWVALKHHRRPRLDNKTHTLTW